MDDMLHTTLYLSSHYESTGFLGPRDDFFGAVLTMLRDERRDDQPNGAWKLFEGLLLSLPEEGRYRGHGRHTLPERVDAHCV